MVFITIRTLKLTCLKCSDMAKEKKSERRFRGPKNRGLMLLIARESRFTFKDFLCN